MLLNIFLSQNFIVNRVGLFYGHSSRHRIIQISKLSCFRSPFSTDSSRILPTPRSIHIFFILNPSLYNSLFHGRQRHISLLPVKRIMNFCQSSQLSIIPLLRHSNVINIFNTNFIPFESMFLYLTMMAERMV
jgi:hypothetical protein